MYKDSSEWNDERVERALSASASTPPSLSETRRSNVLDALLAENARLAAQASPASSPAALWNDDELEQDALVQILAASAAATPALNPERKQNILQALLSENAHLAAEATPAAQQTVAWDEEILEQDSLAQMLAASAVADPVLNPDRRQSVLQALLSENAHLAAEATPATQQANAWDEARIDQALVASAQAVTLISESRRASVRAALAAENARLAAAEKAIAPATPTFWERLNHLFNRRVLAGMVSALAAIALVFAYLLLGGTRTAMVARADGSFSLAETRQGVLGLQWQVPRTFAGASEADIHVGDLVIATTPVTITFTDGTQAIAGVGSQLRMLPNQAVELVAGEMVASTSHETEKFTVQSIGATFVVTDATFRVKVDETGNVTQFTDAGRVVAMTPAKSLEVLAGEQANVLKDSVPVKKLQPPVVAGQKNDDGSVEFTARTLMSSTVVLLNPQTGDVLASFKADENGIVNAAIVPPAGITPEQIVFRADAPDGRKSSSVSVVNDGNAIATAPGQTTLAPPTPSAAATLPTLSLPVLAPAQATSRNGAAVRFSASASDPIDGNLPINCNFQSGATFPIGLTEVVCKATTSQGRTATGSFKVSVTDSLPPIIRLPQMRIQAAATGASGAPVTFTVSAVDTVDGNIQVSCNARSGQVFAIGTTSVQCTAADTFGNVTQGAFEIVVKDDAPPVIRLPDNFTVPANSSSGADVTFNVTANDIVDGALRVACAPTSGSTFPLGTTAVNCSATDKAGNTVSQSFLVSVRDTAAPVISVPDGVNAQATSAAGAPVTFNTTASDVVDGALSVSCTPRSGSQFSIGQTTVTCRVTDNAGNSAMRTFSVSVVDSVAPKIDLPATINASATGPNGAVVNFTSAATDTVDGLLTPSCTPRSGSTFPLGSTTVTCRVTDKAGNSATGTFNVAVRDTTAPVLTLPANIVAEAEAASGAVVNFNVTAKDAIDGAVQPICTPTAGATFPLGSTTVRCAATDKAGNAKNDAFTVNVVDTKPPALKLSDNIVVKAVSRAGATVTFTVSATDIVDGSVTPLCTPRSGSVFVIGDTTVNCTATDRAGNSSSGAFKVTVQHNIPPVLTLPPNQTVEAISPNGAVVSFTVTANSGVEGPIVPVCTPASGSIFPVGTTVVTCRATDDAGNASTDKFNVLVQDTTAPALTLPASMTAEANNGKRGAVVNFIATASDKVDTAVIPVCAPAGGSVFPIGTTAVTCHATDKSGNSSSGVFNVTVVDTIAPVIVTQDSLLVEATSAGGAVVNFNLTANDAADGAVPVVCAPKSGSTFPLGTSPVACMATDQAGNVASASFNVTVADKMAPVLALPANIAVLATASTGATVTFSAAANDVVDGAVAPVCVPASGSTFPLGNTTVTCTATDKAGNVSTGTFVVSVIDNVPPTLVLPDTITVQATSDAGMVVNFTATASDQVDGALTPVCTPASGSVFVVGSTRVDCFATDRSGNTSRGSFLVVVMPVVPTPTPTPAETPITPSSTVTPTVTAAPAAAGTLVTNEIEVTATPAVTQGDAQAPVAPPAP